MSVTKEIIRAERQLAKTKEKQSRLMYSAIFTILWSDYGWKEKRIMTRLAESIDVMKTGTKKEQSVFEVLEEETGIEMTLDGEKSYHEIAFFSGDTTVKPLNDFQYLYMLRHIPIWIPSMLLGAVCIVLHRQDRWGYERLSRFVNRVNILRNTLGEDMKLYSDYMFDQTGHRPEEMWHE